MAKYNSIHEFIDGLSVEQSKYYYLTKELIQVAHPDVCEMLFVNQPYFYLIENNHLKPHHRPCIMLAFFNDHMNILATANEKYLDKLSQYKVTPKHMLQIYFHQPMQREVLVALFKESLL